MERISCIVPAYNEEKALFAVLSVIADHPLLAEVIVIDDGSTDSTKDIVRMFPSVKLLVNEENRGKTASICRGIEESSNQYVLLLDADLVGLTSNDIRVLIEPVRTGLVTVSISLRNYYSWRLFGVDPLSGDRLLPKALLLDHLQKLRTMPSFVLEVYINSLLIVNGCPFTVVPWKGVHAPYKFSKRGLVTGVRGEMRMWKEIISYIEIPELSRQFWNIRKLAKQRYE